LPRSNPLAKWSSPIGPAPTRPHKTNAPVPRFSPCTYKCWKHSLRDLPQRIDRRVRGPYLEPAANEVWAARQKEPTPAEGVPSTTDSSIQLSFRTVIGASPRISCRTMYFRGTSRGIKTSSNPFGSGRNTMFFENNGSRSSRICPTFLVGSFGNFCSTSTRVSIS
jgi:hypothetical protein